MFRKSYSVLQDKLFEHMTEAGFSGFERGVLGSTAENLSSLDYQIQKDKERLADIQERIEAEQVRYEPAHEVHKTMTEIEGMGQKTLTGKIAVSRDDYQQLTALAKEGITSRSEIQDLKSSVSYYQRQYFNASSAVERLKDITSTITKPLAVLGENGKGYTKEANFISWNGNAAKLDIREWHPNHERCGKGITLTEDEGRNLYAALKTIYEKK